jgi:hypothetical protein
MTFNVPLEIGLPEIVALRVTVKVTLVRFKTPLFMVTSLM